MRGMKMKIDYEYSGIKVNADFKDNVNLLYGMSGSGKTFLFEIIQHYCKEKGIKNALFDFKTENTEDNMVAFCKDAGIVLLDNADLYISKELLARFMKECPCILISLKDYSKIGIKDVGMYSVDYTDKKMEVKRIE